MADSERTPILVSAKPSPAGRERARRRWVTVEPVVALGVLGYITLGLLRPFLLTARLGESLYNLTEREERAACEEDPVAGGNVTDDMEADIQSRTSLWLLYLNAIRNVPLLFSNVFLGTLSDRLGRKLCMVCPLIGYSVSEVVYIATVYYELPLAVLFAGEFLQGLLGGFGLLVSGCVSYLIDVTTESQRTLRLAVAEMLVFLAGGLVQIGAGYLIRDVGLIAPLGACLCANALCLVYLAVPGCLVETVDRRAPAADADDGGRARGGAGLGAVWPRIVQLLRANENGRRWQMLLLDAFLFFGLINIYSSMAIFILYGMASPFCWTASTAGLLGAFAFVTSSLAMLIGTKLFSYCLGDYWIMQISCISLLAFDIFMAESTTTALVCIAIALGTLRGMAFPVARSVLSKIINPAETGAAFAIVACLDSLSSFVSNVLAPGIYAATVSYFPQAVFYTLAGLCAFPCAAILILQIFWPQRKGFSLLQNGYAADSKVPGTPNGNKSAENSTSI